MKWETAKKKKGVQIRVTGAHIVELLHHLFQN